MDFENGSYWENINANDFSSINHRVHLSSFEDDIFTGYIESKFTGYKANNLKRNYNENPLSYKDRKIDTYTNIEIKEHNVIDFNKTQINFDEKLKITLEPETIGNKIYLNPFILKFFEENPFKLQERTYPIDFGYKDTYSYVMKDSKQYCYCIREAIIFLFVLLNHGI